MSGNLKRKRPSAAAGASAAITAASTGLSSHQPLDTSTLRSHLQHSLADLANATSRIQSLLDSLPPPTRSSLVETHPPSRSPLTDRGAPPQPHTTTTSPSSPCTSCTDLNKQLSSLRAQIAQHERERQSWKAFKNWWLDSLEKRERRRERGGGKSGLDKVVRRLDEGTRRVWEAAGIVPGNVVSEEQQTEEQSEITLPVHASSKSSKEGLLEKGKSAGDVEKAKTATRDAAMASDDGPAAAISSDLTSLSESERPCSPPPPPRKKSRAAEAPVMSSVARTPATRTSEPVAGPSTRPSTSHTTRPPTTSAPHIDDQPIRNPHHRRTLHASACPDCALFYTHLNAASTTTGEGDISRMACSRHRSTFQRAETPVGYWNIGFPTTQEAEEVNADARRGRGG